MLYTITAASPEVEDFVIELQIESDATFQDLHRLIRQTCGWTAPQPATFHICDDRWRRRKAIPERSYEEDTMDEVELGDHLEDEGQRLMYTFDIPAGRSLLLEVTRIAFSRHIPEPTCRRSHGTAPALELAREEEEARPLSNADLLAQLNAAALAADPDLAAGLALSDDDEDDLEPTDDELFDIEELDLEGFDFNEGQ